MTNKESNSSDFINEETLKRAFENSDHKEIRVFIVDVSRIVADICHDVATSSMIHYCLIVAEVEVIRFRRAASFTLQNMHDGLVKLGVDDDRYYSLRSALKASFSAGSESKVDVISHAVESVMLALEAAKKCSKTTRTVEGCFKNFIERGSGGYKTSYRFSL